MLNKQSILIIASVPASLINFRGHLIRDMLLKNYEVHVSSPNFSSKKDIKAELLNLGVHVHDVEFSRTGQNLIKDVISIVKLYFLIKSVKPNILLAYTIKPVIYGVFAGWLAGVKSRYALITGLGYTFHSNNKNTLLYKIIRQLYSFSLSRTKKVFFQNPDDRETFINNGFIKESKPTIVLNGSGIDIDHFEQKPLPNKLQSFLLISRFLGDKGIREYVLAATKVKKLYPDSHFRLAGYYDYDYPDSIKENELNQWVQSGVIENIGYVQDVRKILTECSVYCLPSYSEGTPRTVLEAMATGRAIITTDAPGCRETVVNNINGILVPVKSVDYLAESMIRLIENPKEVIQMGTESRKIAEIKYDVRKVNKIMLQNMSM